MGVEVDDRFLTVFWQYIETIEEIQYLHLLRVIVLQFRFMP